MACVTAPTMPCGDPLWSGVAPVPPESGLGRTINIVNRSELEDYVNNAGSFGAPVPGDVIVLSPGEYGNGFVIPASCSGTSFYPITFTGDPTLAGCPTFTGQGATTSSTETAGIHVMGGEDAGYLVFQHIEISENYDWAFTLSQTYDGDPNPAGVSDVTIRQCYFHDQGRQHVRGWNNIQNFVIEECRMTNSGQRTPTTVTNEGHCIFLGQGTLDNSSSNITIAYNEFANTLNGGPVNIKTGVTNVAITDNYMHDCVVPLHGAITLATNAGNFVNKDPALVASRNVIHALSNGTDLGWSDSVGIAAGEEFGITCEANLIWDVGDHGIWFMQTQSAGVGGAAQRSRVASNTIAGTGENCYSYEFSVNTFCNLDDGDASGQYSAATPADWVGPITGTADAGDGPGSGFVPSPGGGIIANCASGGATLDVCGNAFGGESGALVKAEGGGTVQITGGGCGGPTQSAIGFLVTTNVNADLSVEWGTSPGVYTNGPQAFSNTGGTSHSHTVTPLNASTTYYFRITADESGGPGVDVLLDSCSTLASGGLSLHLIG